MSGNDRGRTDPMELNRLVHEPARLMILAHLAVVDSADAVFLQRQTGLSWGNLSSHVAKLEDARYVTVKKTFAGKKPNTMFRLTDRGRAAFETYREAMRQVLENPSVTSDDQSPG